MSDEWDSTKEDVFNLEKELFDQAKFRFQKYFPKTERPDLVNELLRNTTLTVIKKIEEGVLVENLSSYYLKVFENTVANFSKNKFENSNQSLDTNELEATNIKTNLDEVEMKILIKEVIRRMDTEMRFIFEMKLFGYEYSEIQCLYEKRFNTPITATNLRKKFDRGIKKLAVNIK